MTARPDLSDDALADLLRATFTAHEDLVDATQVTPPPPAPPSRRVALWSTVAAAAAVVVTIGVVVTTRGGSSPEPVGPSTSHPSTMRSDADNRAATRRLAAHLLERVPMLPGGAVADRAPTPMLGHPELAPDTSPNSISRTRWWTGPGTVRQAVRFYLHHPPTGMDPSVSPGSPHVVELQDATVSASYTTRYVVLRVVPTTSGVAVRGDSYLEWRPVRQGSSYVGVPRTMTVELRKAPALGDPSHVVRRGVVTEPVLIRGVVRSVNEWPGVAPPSCPLEKGPVYSYVVRFGTRYGPVTVRGSSYCRGVQVIRRSTPVAPYLDDNGELPQLIRELSTTR